MKLIDEVQIDIESGAGGNGCVSFRREKYIPFGGPNGGNGGRGGSVFIQASHDKGSLLDFKYQPRFAAGRGQHGMGQDCDGRSGEDLTLKVPVGTIIYDLESGGVIEDLLRDGMQVEVAHGGKGGRGNKTFTSSINRAPRQFTPGGPGERKKLKLELRLMADIGLVGLPNAGKSSFLRSVSRAKPQVADYPFTTLNPHLGVVDHHSQTFVVADLPGLIEGASEGAGLGHQFLKHVTRNRALLHLVDICSGEATADIAALKQSITTIENELEAYDPKLMELPRHLVFTKCDLLTDEALETAKQEILALGLDGYFLSSKTRAGLDVFLDFLAAQVPEWRREGLKSVVIESDEEQPASVDSTSDPDWLAQWSQPPTFSQSPPAP